MDTQILGVELATKLGWNGLDILFVAKAALEDANFHEEALAINRLISNNIPW